MATWGLVPSIIHVPIDYSNGGHGERIAKTLGVLGGISLILGLWFVIGGRADRADGS